MQITTEPKFLLRVPCELPQGMKLFTDEFYEGWRRARSMSTGHFENSVRVLGWNFIKIADGSMVVGVGNTSQEAVTGALRHSLRNVRDNSNVLEIRSIELTRYQWFFLARVGVFPYRVQESATLPPSEASNDFHEGSYRKHLPRQWAAYSVGAGSMHKRMMVLSEHTAMGAQ